MDDFFDDLQRTPRVPNVDNSTTETENVSNSQEPGVNEEGNLNKDSNGASQQTSVDGTIENQSTSLKREDSKVKDVAAIKGMLSEMGVSHYEPEVCFLLLVVFQVCFQVVEFFILFLTVFRVSLDLKYNKEPSVLRFGFVGLSGLTIQASFWALAFAANFCMQSCDQRSSNYSEVVCSWF